MSEEEPHVYVIRTNFSGGVSENVVGVCSTRELAVEECLKQVAAVKGAPWCLELARSGESLVWHNGLKGAGECVRAEKWPLQGARR